jgi:hypothetical protein
MKPEFQQRAKQSLSSYKRDVLKVDEDGVWIKNKERYPHILPQEKYELNILPSIRNEFREWFPSQRIQRHSDFHHLNSSQALCFNLFFPLMREGENGLARLLSAMRIATLPGKGASFEFQPDSDEGTCIDFSLPLQSGARVNFEVKYTESEFGFAKPDALHRQKFENIYECRLVGRFEESFCSEAKFLRHYQIMRNIWYLNEAAGDIAVFLFPKANTRLSRGEETIRTCAMEPFRSRIRILYLEDLVHGLLEQLKPTHTKRRCQLEEFRFKYLSFLEENGAGNGGAHPAMLTAENR